MPVIATCTDEARLACRASKSAVYRRRRPKRTLLYRTVQSHLVIWLALYDDVADCGISGVTEREFHRYVECGILALGFARAHCAECGRDFLRVFLQGSWRLSVLHHTAYGRNRHSSCPGRHSAPTGGQWVPSVPKRLRYHPERNPAILNAALHLFLGTIERTLRQAETKSPA